MFNFVSLASWTKSDEKEKDGDYFKKIHNRAQKQLEIYDSWKVDELLRIFDVNSSHYHAYLAMEIEMEVKDPILSPAVVESKVEVLQAEFWKEVKQVGRKSAEKLAKLSKLSSRSMAKNQERIVSYKVSEMKNKLNTIRTQFLNEPSGLVDVMTCVMDNMRFLQETLDKTSEIHKRLITHYKEIFLSHK